MKGVGFGADSMVAGTPAVPKDVPSPVMMHLVYGPWFNLWFVVYGLRFIVDSLWFTVHRFWSMFYCLLFYCLLFMICGLRFMIQGVRVTDEDSGSRVWGV